MKVLLTGASSFTGYWFVRELAAAGHEVVATFTRRGPNDYASDAYAREDDGRGVRGERVRRLVDVCQPAFGVRFGETKFLDLIAQTGPEVLCHHAADVTDYKRPEFDFARAVASNTQHLPEVLAALAAAGCGRVVLTGSVFEGGEGAGSDCLPHFSPYGLSKALTASVFEHFCRSMGLSLGKFVIPNPFGPYEELRFTTYLARTWQAGETAQVRTPRYVRDNLHVSLLARHYVAFVEGLPAEPGVRRTNPSGYVETQGAFAARLAREMAPRWGIACPVECQRQTEFSEPLVRINTDPCDAGLLNWSETAAWDELAEYYNRPPT